MIVLLPWKRFRPLTQRLLAGS